MMTARFLDISRDLQSRLKKFFDSPLDAAATPLEVCQAVLDDVERRVEPIGRGRRVFPYTRLAVRVRQLQPDRAPLESAFEEIQRKIQERLEELRCEAPRGIDVRVTYLKKAPADWPADQVFAVDYFREPEVQTAPPALPPPVHVAVLRGAATEGSYTFTEPLISIGRSEDPTDALGRVRRNRVAFVDTLDGVTETVGRAHARLRFDASVNEYRLFDDGSSNGTSIIRGGNTIAVPARDPRGVRVQSGDEVQVGRAVLRLMIGE
jgi:FHA domain